MRLDDLIADPRISINESQRALIASRYRTDIAALAKYAFWSGGGGKRPLWEHQKAAISTVVAYLNGDMALPERPEHKEAALLKLPTGTGKSGIIAVLSRCLPNVRKVLVLTPREELTKQLVRDISYRFWGNLNYEVNTKGTFTADAALMGAALAPVYIQTLLPSRCGAIMGQVEDHARVILVGTHQALYQIRASAHSPNDGQSAICAGFLSYVTKYFDLIVVDEGHYEPAISWSRGVREFNRPTLLLSATPYRNDYKSFRVRGRYVFNYSYDDAIAAKIIRRFEVVKATRGKKDDPFVHDKKDKPAVARFIALLEKELPRRLKQAKAWFDSGAPKVMVRGEHLEALKDLQVAIDKAFNTRSVLIHDKAEKTRKYPYRFTSVSAAVKACPDSQFWIHQLKLMEGIDDPAFVVVAIYDLMRNSRQLVQQVGRVTRYKRVKGKAEANTQVGWIIAPPSTAEKIQTYLERYRAYEEYAAAHTQTIVRNEVTLPDRLLELMPAYQYISGQFRRRFDVAAGLTMADIQIPETAAVYQPEAEVTDIRMFSEDISEAILERDRFKVTPIGGLPRHVLGFSYYAWRNSPLLVDRFFSEWRLGIFIAVSAPPFLFMHDTEGLVLDAKQMKLRKASRSVLEKAFPASAEGERTRLSRLSFVSLEMSQNAIRGTAVRTRAFEEVFTDLLDPALVPSTAFGFINNRARYIGFAGARIRDAADGYVALTEYLTWVKRVRDGLVDRGKKRSPVFERYAQIVEGIAPDLATPQSILLDFTESAFIDRQDDDAVAMGHLSAEELPYNDLCAEVDPNTGAFTIIINETEITCKIEYRKDVKKYRLTSDELDARYPARETEEGGRGPTLVQRLNSAQAFRLTIADPGVVYAEGDFYRPQMRWRTEDGAKPILDFVHTAPCLAAVESEKGEAFYAGGRTDWHRRSAFGIFDRACTPGFAPSGADPLLTQIAQYPIWLCDDDNQETADFIGIDEAGARLVFVHAKSAKSPPAARGAGFNVTSLQEVGRQALASLVFMARGAPSTVWRQRRWQQDVQANTEPLTGRNRIFKGGGLDAAELTALLKRAAANPSLDKEMWIVASRMVRRQGLADGLDAPPWTNRLRQFLMHWDSLQTACARANVRLRLFCD